MATEDVIATIAEHDQRLKALEAADKKHIEFRREYYQDREERIRRDTRLDGKIDNICADIKTLLAWREMQVGKPAKRWDNIIDLVIKISLTAVLAKIGLS